jgi:hypothetical protein
MSKHEAPVAPLVQDVLDAAHEVAAAGLEMDSRVEDELHAALLHLVRVVYAHEDALDLQRELEADGVREPPVFDVTSDRPPFTSYTARVEQIIAAADRLAECAEAPAAGAVPQYALAPVCSLVEAVTAYQAHPLAARQWQYAGNRPSLLPQCGPIDTPPPPTTSPPTTSSPSAPMGPEVEQNTGHAVGPGGGGDPAGLAPDLSHLEATPASVRSQAAGPVVAGRGPRLR